MIYVFGLSSDKTLSYVAKELVENGADVMVIDCAVLANAKSLEVDGQRRELRIEFPAFSHVVRPEHVLFQRWIDPSGLAPTEELSRRSKLAYQVIWSYLSQLNSYELINSVNVDRSNFSKPWHSVRLSEEIGRIDFNQDIHIPDFLVSNEIDELLEFSSRYAEGTIIKGISAYKTQVYDFLDTLEGIKADQPIHHALIQQKIKGHDCRVHVFQNEVIAENIWTDDVDYRFSKERAKHQPADLPDGIRDGCVELTRKFGLALAGIDFVVDNDGQYWLLEINGMPGFQGYDKRAGRKIVKCIVRHMLDGYATG